MKKHHSRHRLAVGVLAAVLAGLPAVPSPAQARPASHDDPANGAFEPWGGGDYDFPDARCWLRGDTVGEPVVVQVNPAKIDQPVTFTWRRQHGRSMTVVQDGSDPATNSDHYLSVPADFGTTLRAEVVGQGPQGHYDVECIRDSFGVVNPTMTGRARTGHRLTAVMPAPPDGYDVRYRWYRKVRHYSAVLVHRGPTYRLSPGDRGHRVTVLAGLRGPNFPVRSWVRAHPVKVR